MLQWWLQQQEQAAESVLVVELAAAETAPKSCWRAISFVIYVKVPSLATKMVTVEAQQIVCDSRVVGRGGTRYGGSGAAAELATAELLAEAALGMVEAGSTVYACWSRLAVGSDSGSLQTSERAGGS